MDKVCVFCGSPPQNKNKEHIIPQWLMRLTQSRSKVMSVGSDWKTGKELVFNFSAFTFPACTKCNTAFAEIEGLVKPTMESILAGDSVSATEFIRLLDWFDKVRISLWLGIQYLNKGRFNMPPKYFINSRMGMKDRLLSITNTNDGDIGIKWTGANTPCFIISPTCFTLKVNQVLFTNCSSDFVVSEQLGFPYPAFERPNPKSHLTDFLLLPGNEEVTSPLFRSALYEPKVIVSQPIFGVGISLKSEYYENDYVRNNCYDLKKGQGKLFITADNKTHTVESGELLEFPSEAKSAREYKLNRPTLEFQIELLAAKRYNLELLSPEQQEKHHENLKLLFDYTRMQIDNFDY
jgi:hypothetical protein